MEQFAGQADVVDQKAAGGDSPLAGGIIRVVDITLPGTNYCGPGNKGGTPQRNTLTNAVGSMTPLTAKTGSTRSTCLIDFLVALVDIFPARSNSKTTRRYATALRGFLLRKAVLKD
jgi:hypothetical protein